MLQFNIRKYNQLESTNALCKELKKQENLEEGMVICTEYQTHGKGHGSNSWESEKGKNLLFSLFLQPDFLSAEYQFYLSMISNLALFQSLSSWVKEEFLTIKWPNDIYYQNRKLGGMLIENTLQGPFLGESIVGVGLNVNQEEFSSALPNPISLFQFIHQTINRELLLEKFLQHFQRLYLQLRQHEFEEIHQAYHDKLYLRNTPAPFFYQGEKIVGIIRGVNKFGQLLIEIKDTVVHVNFKEIEFIIG